jgi:hypothetical protein
MALECPFPALDEYYTVKPKIEISGIKAQRPATKDL